MMGVYFLEVGVGFLKVGVYIHFSNWKDRSLDY